MFESYSYTKSPYNAEGAVLQTILVFRCGCCEKEFKFLAPTIIQYCPYCSASTTSIPGHKYETQAITIYENPVKNTVE